ncbi:MULTISPECIES: cytidine deaminase [unclassified Agarivorans]|uniref:cytidine deaminase n=1 Tax=unclassified Agarivorans TaxID=2636026 RepID=UPI0026E35B12|nr:MULTISPECIES: cytidine deaminase [unclassified Agarivorans]MDO6686452.1 cytidine deaminase [Agarivorans sp. 3_MG-2023]MDO6713754.1 cytidine deaminase [Agarivorans sp. 2_MG-2023]
MSETTPQDLSLLNGLKTVVNSELIPSRLNSKQTAALCQRLNCTTIELAERLLPLAASFSFAPKSNFNVGAVAVDKQQQLFLGANYELAYGPLTGSLHAEQSAIFNALSHQASELTHLVINAAPCGYCRQFINELANANQLSVRFNQQSYDFPELLPQSFGPEDLGVTTPLARLALSTASQSPDFAKASYAPYTQVQSAMFAYAGDKVLAWSCYLENVAFNPSLSPLLTLLSQLTLNHLSLDKVERFELWEHKDNQFSFKQELQNFAEHSQKPMVHHSYPST